MSEELKACPFCGLFNIDVKPWHGGGLSKHLVGCANDLCATQPSVTGSSRVKATAAWNTRAADAELARLRAENATLEVRAGSAEDAVASWVTTERAEMRAENARLREALTPSGATKAAYMGAFSFNAVSGDGERACVLVPWTTIKDIMHAITNRALAPQAGEKGDGDA